MIMLRSAIFLVTHPNQTPIPFTFNLDPTTPFNHPITFTLDVLATDGYSATLPFTVTTASSIQNIGALTINTDTIWTADRQYYWRSGSGGNRNYADNTTWGVNAISASWINSYKWKTCG
ncbi:MAG: hypothetical protein IPK53_10680 [bacterium]|nr:hypothetical protein [bacterium]